jgi:protein TonB
MAYLGKLRKTLERHKVNPRSRLAGTVLIRFTVGPTGQVLSREVRQSSGSKLLDDAAMAALDRASPFPPMPQELAHGPLEVQVPFKFITR